MVKEISTDAIWELLKAIPDPEIPAVSIVDLGIVRNVEFDDDQFKITITPTYNGCPAFSFMKEEIIRRLELVGIANFKVSTSLAPPWTTDWMSDEVKSKLKEAGIAPPSSKVKCPQCDSNKAEVISEFGSTACKAMYKCLECLEPFHHFKQI
ncbi:MAG: phenylacetate-CoA oxygenase subunit PaaJ [Candidatus Marinimicrobia bacterium]|nr:phenylacetate-CoA oxygenase subunit PaaJ [Candidatus Neomarinimicrobiota bacterium]